MKLRTSVAHMKSFAGMSMLAAAMAASAAMAAATNRQLVATLELAPFNDITQAATKLGAMINQPLLPAMGLGLCQQSLAEGYGAMRSDAPIVWQAYLDVGAFASQKPGAKNFDPFESAGGEVVVMYPLAVDEAAFMRSHVGSTKLPDGTIKLLAGAGRANETYARFAAKGSYCAFSSDASLARRAAEKFTPPSAGASRHIASAFVNEKGIDFFAALLECARDESRKELDRAANSGGADSGFAKTLKGFQEKRYDAILDLLRSHGSISIDIGFDDSGLFISSKEVFRKGSRPIVPPGTHLPAEAIDGIPLGVGFAYAGNALWQSRGEGYGPQYQGARDFLKALRERFAADDDKSIARYKRSIVEIASILEDMCAAFCSMDCAGDDWSSLSLLFDGKGRPSLSTKAAITLSTAQIAAVTSTYDRVAAVVERQWPRCGIVVKTGDGEYVYDWNRLVDAVAKDVAADAKVKKGGKGKKAGKGKKGAKRKGRNDCGGDVAEDAAKAKKWVEGILGGPASVVRVKCDGKGTCGTVAAPGACVPPSTPGKGAERIFAAVPEARRNALLSGFYLTPYSFFRDVALPAIVKFADADEAKDYKSLLAALPPAAPGGTMAGAAWLDEDGSVSFAMRLTADEIKCIGAAVLAANSAAASGAADDGDGDGDDDDD